MRVPSDAPADHLGYRVSGSGAFGQPDRQVIFVGDLVDRGGEQLQVLETVKRMVDSGSATDREEQ